jgi:CheY-like chemotaxis protein
MWGLAMIEGPADTPQEQGERPPYVLVVDDNPATLRILRVALERIGYEVAAAGDGDEATLLLDQRCPDALVADLIMPGTSGLDLAQRCLERCPETRLVFVSGYDPEYLRGAGITQAVFLPKPIALSDLQSMMRQVLGR